MLILLGKNLVNEKYFQIELEKAKKIVSQINIKSSDEQLLPDLNSVRFIIFSFLEHSVNHFRDLSGTARNINFPLLNPSQKMLDLERDYYFLKIGEIIGLDEQKYIRECYQIIFPNNKFMNILFLDPASKHRNTNSFNEKTIFGVEGEWKSLGSGTDIIENSDGSINLGEYILIAPGSKVIMLDSQIIGPEGITKIKNLNTVEFKGKNLEITKGGLTTSVQIQPFLKDCINCAENILEVWKSYQT